jgi:predicted alpha/beta superfamily hydrolase
MKNVSAWILVLAMAVSTAFAADKAKPAKLPGYVIPQSEVHNLPRNAAGREYALFVRLPDSYTRDPAKRYPVVFVTDGYWDFQKLVSIHNPMVYDKYSPEFIVVGMGYVGENLNYGDLRRYELSPVPFGNDTEKTGHAKDYLDTIEKVFIPLIDKTYRTDPKQRVLGGASLGGAFTLYAMFTKPDLFSAYIPVTPAVMLGDGWLLKYEEEFAKAGKTINARVYMTVGQNEGPGYVTSVLRMNQRLGSRKYPNMAYDFRIIDGARHAGMQIEAYNRGIQFVFAPIAPEQGPSQGGP